MPILNAYFNIPLSAPCIVALPLGRDFSITYQDFRVAIWLMPSTTYPEVILPGEPHSSVVIKALGISVSRDEPESPPEIAPSSDGRQPDWARKEYLRTKLMDYRSAALAVSNRFLDYLRYYLFAPFIRPIEESEAAINAFYSPRWTDASRNELGSGPTVLIGKAPLGFDGNLNGKLGVRKLTPADVPALLEHMRTPLAPTLVATFLSNAQEAVFEGNLRRAVVELAICTEIMAKRRFFAESSPAGAAFDFLDDKAQVSVKVIELIDKVAKAAFGRSYREESLSNYKDIDYLFRCRNKVVHRGELTFRDDGNNTVSVDGPKVNSWWNAVVDLKAWLVALG